MEALAVLREGGGLKEAERRSGLRGGQLRTVRRRAIEAGELPDRPPRPDPGRCEERKRRRAAERVRADHAALRRLEEADRERFAEAVGVGVQAASRRLRALVREGLAERREEHRGRGTGRCVTYRPSSSRARPS